MLKTKLIWWLILLVISVVIFWLIGDQQGYVILVRSPYRIQFSFNFLMVLIVLSLVTFYYALVFLQFLKRLPAKRRNEQEIKQLKNTEASLIAAITALANDDLEGAAKAVLQAKKLQNNESIDEMIGLINLKRNQTQSNN
jgi:uncharacterized protein HemY